MPGPHSFTSFLHLLSTLTFLTWWNCSVQLKGPITHAKQFDRGSGTPIGWNTSRLGWIGCAFGNLSARKGMVLLVFVPVRVRFSRCRPSRVYLFWVSAVPPGQGLHVAPTKKVLRVYSVRKHQCINDVYLIYPAFCAPDT